MHEAMTATLGTLAGLVAEWRRALGTLLIFASLVIGATETPLTGEYRGSWFCLLPDTAEAVIVTGSLQEAVQPMIVSRRAPVGHASWIVPEHFSGGAVL
jgi:hypothetical protein